jgi:hypothetical protein
MNNSAAVEQQLFTTSKDLLALVGFDVDDYDDMKWNSNECVKGLYFGVG